MSSESNHFAVVGTDTSVGKTVVTAGVVGWLRAEGYQARAIKPAQTGYPPDDDAEFVARACGTSEASTCLRYVEPPLAPSVAAVQEGVTLEYEAILEECAAELASVTVGVIEGIGGLRVPLADGQEVIDLIADLDVPVVLVARSGLGTLNHTALSVEALEQRGVSIHGVILNRYTGASVAERTNPDVIAEMTGLPVWTVPEFTDELPAGAVDGVREALDCRAVPTLS